MRWPKRRSRGRSPGAGCTCSAGRRCLLKIVGLFVPLRMTEEEMEQGDIAVHGHEVYPSDVPSLGYPDGIPAAASAGGTSP
jgi:hypothetical protein